MSGLPCIIIDTSTLIGAVLRPNSTPRQAFVAAVTTHEVCVSAATLEELREVLHRAKFDSYAPVQLRLDFLALLMKRSRLVHVTAKNELAASGVCRDPKDAKFLAVAVASRAATLISSDADLLVLNRWNDIRILTPAAFLKAGPA